MTARLLSGLLVLCLTAAACANSESGGGGSSGDETPSDGRPGVTDETIRVGGVASVTNPLGGDYGDAFVGAAAYFDEVNDDGGVFGRSIDLVAERDDAGAASRNASHVRALVEEDDVFAVIPVATLSFRGASYLADEGVPTFGWNINAEWSSGPTLFGEKGSFLCFTCAGPYLPFLASSIGASKVAIIAYTSPQSADCAEGQRNSFDEFGPGVGVEVAFEDSSLNFGFTSGDIAADIRALRENDIDLLTTCIDGEGSARLAQALEDAGLDVPQYLPNGYDPELVEQNADILEGSYASLGFTPFQVEDQPDLLARFLAAMEDRDKVATENALAGWINADLFVTGLRAAGEDFSQASLVEAINAMADYDAGGILPGIDWGTAHTGAGVRDCATTVRISDGSFEPVFGEPGRPFTCWPDEEGVEVDVADPDLVG